MAGHLVVLQRDRSVPSILTLSRSQTERSLSLDTCCRSAGCVAILPVSIGPSLSMHSDPVGAYAGSWRDSVCTRRMVAHSPEPGLDHSSDTQLLLQRDIPHHLGAHPPRPPQNERPLASSGAGYRLQPFFIFQVLQPFSCSQLMAEVKAHKERGTSLLFTSDEKGREECASFYNEWLQELCNSVKYC